ncbi:putative bifunctional diguanylate cyclase/phosphodiesterase [Marinobacterium sp. YM272]|uniref:putative bifunctional diguanylate cyclase/phosphodiesterase n=1 Tax=Marinobacterium sp. YM272 TaxID=3421654 RepID=UPI003D7F9919
MSSFNSIQSATAAFGVVIIGFIWSFTYHQLDGIRQETLDAKAAEQRNLVTIAAENLRQVTARARLITQVIDPTGAQQGERQDTLQLILASDPVFTRLSLFDEFGSLLYTSTYGRGSTLLPSELERLQIQRAGFGDQAMVLRSPRQLEDPYRPPDWQLPFLAMVARSGATSARNIVLLELDLGYLLSVYQRMEFGRSSLIQIYDPEGRERVRASAAGLVVGGQSFPSLPDTGAGGTVRTEQASEAGIPYQTLVLPVPELGLSIVVRQSVEEILTSFRATEQRYRSVLLLTTLLIAVALIWLLWMQQRRQRNLRELSRAHADNNRLIANLEQEHRRSSHAASTDHLTGLLNRRSFMQQAEVMMEQLPDGQPLAVLFIDLDRFKSVNDSLGHRTGDLLLTAVASRIESFLTDQDRAARIGGDEFVVLLGSRPAPDELPAYVAALRDRLNTTYQLEDERVHISPSIGVAWAPDHGDSVEELIRHADVAMYAAKKAGRGRYRVFEKSQRNHSAEGFLLEQRFEQALQQREFRLHYQPKMDLHSGKIVGFEALVRWQHPQLGLLSPDRFIPLAESSGFIADLGAEVLSIACHQLRRWRSMDLEVGHIAVNVAPRQLQQPGFATQVLAIIERERLHPADLELEVTETAILDEIPLVMEQLDQLSRAGVGIALDDFGKGYAGFAHLQKLPIRTLKIDRELINEIGVAGDEPPILAATLALAQRLSLVVVAEGIETEGQLGCLQRLGCTLGQGYLFSKPLDLRDATPLLSMLSMNSDQKEQGA